MLTTIAKNVNKVFCHSAECFSTSEAAFLVVKFFLVFVALFTLLSITFVRFIALRRSRFLSFCASSQLSFILVALNADVNSFEENDQLILDFNVFNRRVLLPLSSSLSESARSLRNLFLILSVFWVFRCRLSSSKLVG